MLPSPTTEHLYAVCIDDQNMFCTAGAAGTVIRGNQNGFEVICSTKIDADIWDIEWFNGELVVACDLGLFVVRNEKLEPFDTPPPHESCLSVTEDVLWSIGKDHIYRLENNTWEEWVCPYNA